MGVDLAVVVLLGSAAYLTVASVRLVLSPTTVPWPDNAFWFSIGFLLIIAVVYLTGTWAITGRSLGDTVLGLRVLSSHGDTPGWSLAFVRAVACVLLPTGLFWVILSPQRRSLQDVILRTIVVYDWDHERPTANP